MRNIDSILSDSINPALKGFGKASEDVRNELKEALAELKRKLEYQSVLFTDSGKKIFDREVEEIFKL